MKLPTLRRNTGRAARIVQLGLPEPFDLLGWRDNLAARRGRPIELWPGSSDEFLALTGDSGVHALLLAIGQRDIVYYKADIPAFMVEHNLIHEFCHLACNHRVPLVAGCDMNRLEQICLTRASASSGRRDLERETEELALWVERYRSDSSTTLAAPEGPLPNFYSRVAAVLGDRPGL